MALVLVLLLLALPIAELALIVAVAGEIGVLNAVGLLVLVSIVGAWLAKREGIGLLGRIRAALDRGEMPSREVADGFLILLAGALMIVPGFLSDGVAVLLLLPPTRALARHLLFGAVVRRGRIGALSARGRQDGGPTVVRDAESWEEAPRSSGELGGPR